MTLTPEQQARENIDGLLTAAGWTIQNRAAANPSAGRGVAVREFPMKSGYGEADYLLYVDGMVLGVIEAKKEGSTLTGFELQTEKYSNGLPDALPAPRRPLPIDPNPQVENAFGANTQAEMTDAAATALTNDADLVVVGDATWFPYFEEFHKLNLLISDSSVLMRQCEIFVRGHDTPWSFDHTVWNQVWTAFYQLSEAETFRDGFRFLELCHEKKLDLATQDTARMLIHNRLPNLCFTRDRLLFYEIQQSPAKRAGWKRQDFAFETGYYLNFYYLLIYGGFDHLALVVNGSLGLGLSQKQVGVTYEPFLNALRGRSPEIEALFRDADVLKFVKRIGALRHFAAHRGSIMPGKLYEEPEIEPTKAELDEEIAKLGLDDWLNDLPEGRLRDSFRETLRFQQRLTKYKEIAEGIIPIEIDGKWYYISPMDDIGWNFNKFHTFMVKVLNACAMVMESDRQEGRVPKTI